MVDTLTGVGFYDRLPVDEAPLLIDGRATNWYGVNLGAEGVVMGEAKPVTSYVDMAGWPGGADLSLRDPVGAATPSRRDVTIHLVASAGDELDLLVARRRVGQLNGRRVDVYWPAFGGTLTGDVSVGAWSETWRPKGVTCWMETYLTVSCDPWVWGLAQSFWTNTDGVTVNVEGTRQAFPVVTATPSADTKRYYVTVRNSAGETTLKVDAEYDGVKQLVMDSASRMSLLGDTPVFPLIDSDYPMLVPGLNTVLVSAGRAQVAYTPMFMI